MGSGKRIRWKLREAKRPAAAPLTLGDVVAAAFDALGPDVRRVASVLASRPMQRALRLKLVLG